MALIPGRSLTLKDRSANARLVVSGIEQPAESFITDPNLPVLFSYPFGFPGLRDVVIPKGIAVAVNGRAVDPETGKKKPVLTIANGTLPYVGIAPYNICKKYDDSLVGNEATFIRQVYAEFPLFSAAADAALVKYGAVYGDVQEGDLLVVSGEAGNVGKLTKYSGGDPTKVVGQIIAIEDDVEPWGWLKWAMWDEAAKREDSPEPDWAQNAVPGEGGYGYNPAYRDGTIYQNKYLSDNITRPTGIPGLTDGALRGSVRVPFTVSSGQASAVVNLGQTLVKNGLVRVFVNDVELPRSSFVVDYTSNQVTVNLPYAPSENLSGYVICQTQQMYGTPPGWDYVSALGVARVLIF